MEMIINEKNFRVNRKRGQADACPQDKGGTMTDYNNMNLYSQITPEIRALADICRKNNNIDPELYAKYDVKRGLRDVNGKGVLTGLTEIAEVKSYTIDDDEMVPCPGKLYYRGYDIEDLVNGCIDRKRMGFEEVAYLLMFGFLPTQETLISFNHIVGNYRSLPTTFVRDIIMKAPSSDMMNTLARCVLTMYAYDDNPDDISIENVLRQCTQLMALMPVFAAYGFQTYEHYIKGNSLFIHQTDPDMSTAETILHLLRPDGKFDEFEAFVLDLCLILHADHGGGNNSAFTTRVVTSSHTDTYSAISAGLAALKGPRHGGANIKVMKMMDYLKDAIKDWDDDDEIRYNLEQLSDGEAFDRSGLIYGIGHAVYSMSDPREEILKGFVTKLAGKKGCEDVFTLYDNVERIAKEVIIKKHKMYRANICANVDFYSGFVYEMLGIPRELYTPLFAIARTAGWSAHRIEELVCNGKIIRPAYKSVTKHTKYIPMEERTAPVL